MEPGEEDGVDMSESSYLKPVVGDTPELWAGKSTA